MDIVSEIDLETQNPNRINILANSYNKLHILINQIGYCTLFQFYLTLICLNAIKLEQDLGAKVPVSMGQDKGGLEIYHTLKSVIGFFVHEVGLVHHCGGNRRMSVKLLQ